MSPKNTAQPMVSARERAKLQLPGLGTHSSLAQWCAAMTLALSAPVIAQQALNIPAQPLSEALRILGEETGLQIIYDASLVSGRISETIQGNLQPTEALNQLLSGTDITYSISGNSVALQTINGNEPPALETVRIKDSSLSSTTEGTGSYTSSSANTSTKLSLSLRETPQSVSIITRQKMEDHNLTKLNEVLSNIAGVSLSNSPDERTEVYSRGFSVSNYQYDGSPTYELGGDESYGLRTKEMAIYDRVEIVRGASGLVSGTGTPGAVINLVLKRPTEEFRGYVSASTGSWKTYRAEVDISGPLVDDGSIKGRMVTAYQDGESFLKVHEKQNSLFYGIVEFDISKKSTLSAGIEYQDRKTTGTPWGGFPVYFSDEITATNFSRSWNSATDWSKQEVENIRYFSDFQYSIENGGKLKVSISHLDINQIRGDSGNIPYWGAPDLETGQAYTYQDYADLDIESNSFDIEFSSPFTLVNREHEILIGINYSEFDQKREGYENGYVDVNYLTWNNLAERLPRGDLVSWWENHIVTKSLYAATKLNITDKSSLIVGSRYTDYQLDGPSWSSYTNIVDVKAYEMNDKKLVPYAGFLYDFHKNFSFYVSYTDIFEPSNYKDENGSILDSKTGKNYELGIKTEHFNGLLNGYFSIYKIDQENVPEYAGINANGDSYYRTIAKTKSRGYDIEISGRITDKLQLNGSYTYNSVRDQSGDPTLTRIPKKLFKLHTSYLSTSKLTLGGSTSWQSSTYNGDRKAAAQDSFWVTNLFSRYKITENLETSININNIFDKKYYSSLTASEYYYGDPRNITASISWAF